MKRKLKKIEKMFICLLKYIYYFILCKVKRINNDSVWLIAERGNDARDNSYHFYKYIKENHKNINIKYVMDKKSSDAKKIDNNDIVEYGSKEHYLYFLTASKLISTHIMGYSPDMSIFWRLDKLGLLKLKGKKIMLQHGITQNYLEFMSSKIAKLDLFICGAYPEYQYILENYGYTEKEVKYTGFARYDKLKNKEKNQILVMPTFRKWLNYTDDFSKSEYFKKWNEILNQKELLQYLEEKDLELIFYPHYEIQKYLDNFSSSSERIIIASFNNYDVQKLLIESKILITDYSSVFFDFAYMRKPVIYYQFDIDKFRSEHYKQGFFDYEKMGFGPVCKTKKDVTKALKNIDTVKNKNISEFFKYSDFNNCRRIYEEIIKL